LINQAINEYPLNIKIILRVDIVTINRDVSIEQAIFILQRQAIRFSKQFVLE